MKLASKLSKELAPRRKDYIEREAAHSGDESSEGGPEDDEGSDAGTDLSGFLAPEGSVSEIESEEEDDVVKPPTKPKRARVEGGNTKGGKLRQPRVVSDSEQEHDQEQEQEHQAPPPKRAREEGDVGKRAREEGDVGKRAREEGDVGKRAREEGDIGKRAPPAKNCFDKRPPPPPHTAAQPEAAPTTRVKTLSNKVLPTSAIPPKPHTAAAPPKRGTSAAFSWRLTFPDGAVLKRFLEPVASAVTELRFMVTRTPAFTGVRVETHDKYFAIACRSQCACTVEGEEDAVFSVSAATFLKTLTCALLKDAPLTLTQYASRAAVVSFESSNEDENVHSKYDAALLSESTLNAKLRFKLDMQLHVPVALKTLRDTCGNAAKCGATYLSFSVFQATEGEVVHSRLRIGFVGDGSSGSHDFFISARSEGSEWTQLVVLDAAAREELDFQLKATHAYHNAALRTFLAHVDAPSVLLHLNTQQDGFPLAVEVDVAGSGVKHTVIIAAKEEDGDALKA